MAEKKVKNIWWAQKVWAPDWTPSGSQWSSSLRNKHRPVWILTKDLWGFFPSVCLSTLLHFTPSPLHPALWASVCLSVCLYYDLPLCLWLTSSWLHAAAIKPPGSREPISRQRRQNESVLLGGIKITPPPCPPLPALPLSLDYLTLSHQGHFPLLRWDLLTHKIRKRDFAVHKLNQKSRLEFWRKVSAEVVLNYSNHSTDILLKQTFDSAEGCHTDTLMEYWAQVQHFRQKDTKLQQQQNFPPLHLSPLPRIPTNRGSVFLPPTSSSLSTPTVSKKTRGCHWLTDSLIHCLTDFNVKTRRSQTTS